MDQSQQTFEYRSREDLLIDCSLLADSDIFDAEAYSAAAGLESSASAAEHYLIAGWRAGIEPGPHFEGNFLLPYFRTLGLSQPPAITYLMLRSAGWPVYPTRARAEAVASIIRGSNLFDANAYASRLGNTDLDPALHYVLVGERMSFAPSASFDPEYYEERYPDIARARVSYLLHFIRHGSAEKRRPVSVASQLAFDCSRLDPKRRDSADCQSSGVPNRRPDTCTQHRSPTAHHIQCRRIIAVGRRTGAGFRSMSARPLLDL